MQEEIDVRNVYVSYYNGGIGAGTQTRGDMRFVNLRLNPHVYIGKKLFAKIGVFFSHSLSITLTEGQLNSFYLNQTSNRLVKNEKVYLEKTDRGITAGIGYTWHNMTLLFDFHQGIIEKLADRHIINNSHQINMSVIVPLSFKFH